MAKYGSITVLNAQWQTSYTSWTDFLNKRNVTPNLTGANVDLLAFDQLYANQYHSETLQALRVAPRRTTFTPAHGSPAACVTPRGGSGDDVRRRRQHQPLRAGRLRSTGGV
ncbi:MAG: hypothetical protein R3C45_12560 [Phycisphaerales bacterium]